jgi:dynein heavy chain
LYNKKHPAFYNTKVKILNPKSISMGELYGEENPDTKEWTDGLASKIIRKAVSGASKDVKTSTWTVFDGPVDSLWIENMNTVLDDNMTLCLANGERIKLKQSLRILFEVQDLKVASPATVSRCGMVYMTPSDLGWKPYVHQWMCTFIQRMHLDKNDPNYGIPLLSPDTQQELQLMFDTYVDEAFTKLKPYADQMQMRVEPVQIVKNICNFLETFLSKPNGVNELEK